MATGEIGWCERCVQLAELINHGGWALCSECDDLRTFDDHEEDLATAYYDGGPELPLCHCDACARHRQRLHSDMVRPEIP